MSKVSQLKQGATAIFASAALFALAGALHGSAITASAFDSVITVLTQNILFTGFTTMIAIGVLILAVVRMMTGQGNTMFIVTIATAMPVAAVI